MITIEDSLKLALIQFKVRKISSIFSMIILLLSVIIIMIFFLGYSGIRNILWQAYPDRYGTHFAEIEWYGGMYRTRNGTDNKIDLESSIPSISDFRSLYQDKYDIKGIYSKTHVGVQVRLKEYDGNLVLDGSRRSSEGLDGSSRRLLVIDPYLSKESVFDGYSLENKYGGKIPLILDAKYAKDIFLDKKSGENLEMRNYSTETFDIDFLKEAYELQKKLHEYIGKESTVSIDIGGSERFSFKGIIVGYVGSLTYNPIDRFKFDDESIGIIIPDWARSANEDIGSLFNNQEISKLMSYVVEFDSIEERSRFVEDMNKLRTQSNSVFQSASEPANNSSLDKGYRCNIGTRCYGSVAEEGMVEPNNGPQNESVDSNVEMNYYTYALVSVQELFEASLKPLFYIVVSIASVFLTVGMAFVTINVLKILADSRKEIGIFRAVGAQQSNQQSDIVKIFMSYVFLILTGGFLISLIVAVSINILLSLFFGDAIYYSLVLGSSQIQLAKPLFVFVGFPFVELSVFYIILIATGFLAAIVSVLLSSRRNLISALRSE